MTVRNDSRHTPSQGVQRRETTTKGGYTSPCSLAQALRSASMDSWVATKLLP